MPSRSFWHGTSGCPGMLDLLTLAEIEVLEKAPQDIVMNSLGDILKSALSHLPNIGAAVIVILLTWVIAFLFDKFVPRALGKTHWRTSLRELATTFGKIVIWMIGLMVAAMILFPGLSPSKALGAAGLASVAIGLAFKDIFQNFFAGILLLWKFPFEPGDFIECGDITGKVLETQLRLTTIRQTDGELVVIPNAYLIENPVNVLTSKDLRRIEVNVGVGYGEDLSKVIPVIQKTLDSCDLVSSVNDRRVLVSGFGESSMNLDLLFWAESTPRGQRAARSQVVIAVKAALDEAGIEIPFPYRTLTFPEPLHVVDQADGGTDPGEPAE